MRAFIITYAILGILSCVMCLHKCLGSHPRKRDEVSAASDVTGFVVQVAATIWACKLLGWL